MKYKTISYGSGYGARYARVSDALGRLDQEVNLGLSDGWILVDGVSVAINNSGAVVTQAMALPDPPAQPGQKGDGG